MLGQGKKVRQLITYFPSMTSKKTMSQSKADVFTKFIALLHVIWFLVHFFTRMRRQLLVSELEVGTLAYIPMAIGTYSFWWHKPMGLVGTVALITNQGIRDRTTKSQAESPLQEEAAELVVQTELRTEAFSKLVTDLGKDPTG